ncbi:MAG: T9SS type A sorting domain-containing protein [Ignavibacteriae bacterium]|nr:T9SS type A sorting domain-containing protein [Ignavibacteriota bacterium]
MSEEFYIPKVYSLSSNNLIALYISQKDSSLHSIITNDNGATWELNNTDNRGIYQEFITTIYMVNDKYGIAFNNVIWQTNDGGNEWGKKNNALNLFPPPCEIFFINDSIGWIVGNSSYYATDAGFLAKTINGGESWEIIDSRTMLLYGIDFINSNIGYAVGTNWNFGTGFIYHTENAGDTWQIEQYIGAKAFWDVGFLDVKNGWITGVGKILKTIDGGVSWETQIEGLLTNLNKIQILKEEKVAYIFGDDFNNRTHTLLKADLSTISDIKNKEIISNELSLSQNYPNPFNSITSIYFNLNRNRHVQLKIYNFLGKEVTTLINEELFPGNYEIEWNGKNNQGDEVTSGIYFYSIMTDLNNEVKKMILLK